MNEEIITTLVPGKTTKDDVFLSLGEPDKTSPDGTCMIYSWEKVKAIWMAGGMGAGAVGAFSKIYDLNIFFDDRDIVLRTEFGTVWDFGTNRQGGGGRSTQTR